MDNVYYSSVYFLSVGMNDFKKPWYKDAYILLNFAFIVLLFLLLVYFLMAAFYRFYPIKCNYKLLTGYYCPSCGLSRSISAFLRGDFVKAVEMNTSGIKILFFFLVQFFMRIIISILLKKKCFSRQLILYTDIIISIALFFYCFKKYLMLTLSLL